MLDLMQAASFHSGVFVQYVLGRGQYSELGWFCIPAFSLIQTVGETYVWIST